MLNKLRLLLNSGELLDAIKCCCEDVQISGCWNHDKLNTVHTSASFEGNRLNAWGTDINESIALAKSLVELIERIHIKEIPISWINMSSGEQISDSKFQNKWHILQSFLQTSSGMAAHFNNKNAKQNALYEIIERHVITKAMLEGVKAHAILNDIFVWKGPLECQIAVVRHNTGNGKYVYGTAASESVSRAVSAAKREISALIQWSQNSANVSHLLQEATPNQPSEIQAYHLEQKRVIDIFEASNPEEQIISSHITLKDIWFAEIPLLNPFERTGIKVVRAFSPLMQPLYFGKLSEGPINPAAIDLSRLNIQAEYNVVA